MSRYNKSLIAAVVGAVLQVLSYALPVVPTKYHGLASALLALATAVAVLLGPANSPAPAPLKAKT